MPSAEIIAIGTELLLGEVHDSNSQFLARQLREIGVDLFRVTIVGDNMERIAAAIRESLSRCQIIITGGGLGPTVDDPTREAVASALGTTLEFHPELWESIEKRFARSGRKATENNRRQAYIPIGAKIIENPVGTAPAFSLQINEKSVICLPGVPREMEYLMQSTVLPYLTERYSLHEIIRARVLHTAGVGESQVDEWIADLETLSNPTVGLLAHSGQVDIRITAKAGSRNEAEQLIAGLEKVIVNRLGDSFFGVDEQTLESIILQLLKNDDLNLTVWESGFQESLASRLEGSNARCEFHNGNAKDLQETISSFKVQSQKSLFFAVQLTREETRHTLDLVSSFGSNMDETGRIFSGPQQNAELWAVNTSLDHIRRMIIKRGKQS